MGLGRRPGDDGATEWRGGRRRPVATAAALLLSTLALTLARPAEADAAGAEGAPEAVCVRGPAGAAAALRRALVARLPGTRVSLVRPKVETSCDWLLELETPTARAWDLTVRGGAAGTWQRRFEVRRRSEQAANVRAAAVWVSDLVQWAALAPPDRAAPPRALTRRSQDDGARRARGDREAEAPTPARGRWRLALGLAAQAAGGAGDASSAASVTGGLLLRLEGGGRAGLQGVLRVAWGHARPTGGHDIDAIGVAPGVGWRFALGAPLALTVDVHALAAPWTARGDERRSGWRFGGGLGAALTVDVAPRVALFADAALDGVTPPVAFHGADGELFRLGRWGWWAGVGLSVGLLE